MAGLDALVFTGGVGENAAALRAATPAGIRFLGLEINPALNAKAAGDADISAGGGTVRTFVIHAHEDLEVVRSVRQVLADSR